MASHSLLRRTVMDIDIDRTVSSRFFYMLLQYLHSLTKLFLDILNFRISQRGMFKMAYNVSPGSQYVMYGTL